MDIKNLILIIVILIVFVSSSQLIIRHKLSWRRLEKLTSLLRSKPCQAKNTKKVFIISSFLKTGISVCDTDYPFAFHILNYNNVYIPFLDLNVESRKLLEKSFGKKLTVSITSIN
ncbi:MAG: hypothetical protein ABIJ28_00020 [Patescibacteria group bacterium]